jgi:hypothetical protein
MGALQRFGVLDQDAVAGGDAGAGHDRGGRGQAEGAGAGDHQHGDGVDQRGFQRRAGQPPADQGEQGQHQHGRHEHLADPVDQFLDRRLGRLGVFHQADDARQHGFGAQARVRTSSRPSPLIAPPVTVSPGCLGTGRLSPLISASSAWLLPSSTSPSTGKRSPGLTSTRSPRRNWLIATSSSRPSTTRTRAPGAGFEGADGAGGLALGAAFQVFAQQHQGDHHRRGFEIQVRLHAGGRGPLVQAQAVTGAGAQGDQQVHVAGPGAHGLPGGDVEARAEMNCTGVASRNCAQAGSIQCRPNGCTSIGSTSGSASSRAAPTARRSLRRRRCAWAGRRARCGRLAL